MDKKKHLIDEYLTDMDSEIQQIKARAKDLIVIANFPSMEKTVTDLLKEENEIMQKCITNYESIQKRFKIDCEISPSPPSTS